LLGSAEYSNIRTADRSTDLYCQSRQRDAITSQKMAKSGDLGKFR